ncbi:MAG: DUF3788 domain-containing protein [Defluviitaleaceae bacterium]|nr:DUF3788 domain-containing protein [Defluviitaleaceae bacterium]
MERPVKSYDEVKALLGGASAAFEKLAGHIRFYYVMDEVWAEGNPAHKHYNNLYFRRGGKTLVNLCLREGYFIVSVVLGKDEREKFEAQRESFGEAVCQEYDAAETYHDGKWMGFDVSDDSLVDEIFKLLQIKRKPNRKILPESLEKCAQLDIGLSHHDVTNFILSEKDD